MALVYRRGNGCLRFIITEHFYIPTSMRCCGRAEGMVVGDHLSIFNDLEGLGCWVAVLVWMGVVALILDLVLVHGVVVMKDILLLGLSLIRKGLGIVVKENSLLRFARTGPVIWTALHLIS